MDKVCGQIEEQIKMIINDGVSENNVCYLGQLIDIHKDLANEKYWEAKEEMFDMRYRNDGRMYGARRRDSRGRYMESGNYGKRYRGHDMIDEMSDNYGTYMEGKEDYRRGNYNGQDATIESLDYMLQSVEDFMDMLMKDSDSEEEKQMIRETARKISMM